MRMLDARDAHGAFGRDQTRRHERAARPVPHLHAALHGDFDRVGVDDGELRVAVLDRRHGTEPMDGHVVRKQGA